MDRTINIQEFGAKGDGTLCTNAVNRAISSLAGEGGTVFFPNGLYVTGTIFLESNVTLLFDRQAILEGSKDIEDYHVPHEGCIEAPSFDGCLLYAEDKENVKLTGGRIRGNGGVFEGERPMLTRFVRCRNVVLEDISLGESGSWCNHFVLCDRVFVNRVEICNKVQINNDGLDFDDCKNVFITNSIIETGDDSICLKSSSGGICENILVSNCTLSSKTAVFKTGTASKGGFRNVTLSNCVFHDCEMGCIKLICVDGGILENMTFSNIVMDRVGSPLFIRLGRRNLKFEKPAEMEYFTPGIENEDDPGVIRNILISDIRANVTLQDKERTPIMITGLNGHYVEKIQLNNLNLTFPGGGTKEDAERQIAEDDFRYPEQWFFGVLPAYAVFARHVKGLWMNNIWVDSIEQDAREICICEDVQDAKYLNCTFSVKGDVTE